MCEKCSWPHTWTCYLLPRGAYHEWKKTTIVHNWVRRHELMRNLTPSPNTYHIPSYFGCKISNKPSAPVHIIRGRTLELGHFRPPGATSYTLPELEIYNTRLPRHTITGRTEWILWQSNPGPGAFMPLYIAGGPVSQFSSRIIMKLEILSLWKKGSLRNREI
jgi:hypothetical protein